MNDFTASNGVAVREATPVTDRGPWLLVDGEQVSPNNAQALREFFLAEADERLGRWRWPENPDYVVYPCSVKTRVRVLRESGAGDLEWVDQGDGRSYEFVHAARAYFDAHPEPKPWHDAQIGELWVIRLEGQDEVGVSVEGFEPGADVFQIPGGESISITRPSILAGRRIWPEVSS